MAPPNTSNFDSLKLWFNIGQPGAPTHTPVRWLRNYHNLPKTERDDMTADEVFALYLNHMSIRSNQSFYFIVLRFTLLFRECLNKNGWKKKIETENINIAKFPELKK